MKRKRKQVFNTCIWSFGEIANIVLKVIGSLAICIVLLILYAKLEAIAYSIVINSIATAVIIFFTFISKKRPPLREKIISCAIAVSLWFPLIIGTRRALIIDTAVFWTLCIYLVCMYIFEKKVFAVLNGEAIYLLFFYISTAFIYTFSGNTGYLKLMLLPAILAVVSIPITVILLEKGAIELDKPTPFEGILTVLLIAIVTFTLLFMSLCNLNFALDTSTPTEHETVIREAYTTGGGRTSTHYTFILDLNGKEIEFEASPKEYFMHSEGDSFNIELYEGAFGVQYYISGDQER